MLYSLAKQQRRKHVVISEDTCESFGEQCIQMEYVCSGTSAEAVGWLV